MVEVRKARAREIQAVYGIVSLSSVLPMVSLILPGIQFDRCLSQSTYTVCAHNAGSSQCLKCTKDHQGCYWGHFSFSGREKATRGGACSRRLLVLFDS